MFSILDIISILVESHSQKFQKEEKKEAAATKIRADSLTTTELPSLIMKLSFTTRTSATHLILQFECNTLPSYKRSAPW